ncbi:MAG: hypothetical protein JXB62_16615 [Pirellulales bacterium]|nr:hypothetical protein [Pirellulales bacterium]
MNVAIVHYHLNRGGVTRVIENQLAALDAVLDPGRRLRVALIFGGRRKGWNEDLPRRLQSIELSLHPVPSLDYETQGRAGNLCEDLCGLLDGLGFAAAETVLHVHNHALGKNVVLPSSLLRLAESGFALLLQIHDFPEDFRPNNYRRLLESGLAIQTGPTAALYPQARQVHYAVLNGRDQSILAAAGVDSRQLHLLPNPVPDMAGLPPRDLARQRLAEQFGVGTGQPFVLYPVRGIRRKNLGEALLCTALAPEDAALGLTLPPLNPAALPVYRQWKRTAVELDLPFCFEVGAPERLTFAENLAAADLILTTSLAEGFGMVFLESWLADRPLAGRDLPEITRDFTELGVRLDRLQPRLRVPLAWVGSDAFREMLLAAYRKTLDTYRRQAPADIRQQCEARTDEGTVDFGDLDETLQQQVLRLVCGHSDRRRELRRHNPEAIEALSLGSKDVAALVRENVQAVQAHYGLAPSGRRLWQLYRRAAGSVRDDRCEPLPRPTRIIEAFLELRRFHPICT